MAVSTAPSALKSSDAEPTALFGVVTVTLTLIGWSSIPLFLRHFAELIDYWTANGWRYGASALIWAPVLLVGMYRKRLPRGVWKAAIVPSIINAIGQVCFTAAHYHIDPGLLAFGLRSQLLFVAVGAWLMFPQERRIIGAPGYVIGALLLVIGMVGVLAYEPAQASDAGHGITDTGAQWGTTTAHIVGVALALASGVFFAAYGLAVRKYMHGVHSVVAFATICQYTAAAMVVGMVCFGRDAGAVVFSFDAFQFWMLIASAVIGIAIGHVFYYISIARLGVAVSAGVLQLQPFLVAVGSLVLFDEILSTPQWVGGCVAVAGALLMLSVQYRLGRRRRAAESPVAIAEGESGS